MSIHGIQGFSAVEPRMVSTEDNKAWECSELNRRLEYIHTCSSSTATRHELKLLISEVALRRGDSPPPSLTTVRRWLHLYRARGTPWSVEPFSLSQKELENRKLSRFYEE